MTKLIAMLNDSEDVKDRFASLIASVLRSSAEGAGVGAEDELEASVQRSERCVLVRLHWRKKIVPCVDRPSSTDGSRAERLISYRVYPQVGDCNVVIMVTRDAGTAAAAADQPFVH